MNINKLIIILIISIGFMNIISNPAMAFYVTFSPSPTDYKCSCGDTAIITTTISGKAEEFGNVGGEKKDGYRFDLGNLFVVNGLYGTNVKDNDDIKFVIQFRLKCGDNCELIKGVGIESFYVYINNIKTTPITIKGNIYDYRYVTPIYEFVDYYEDGQEKYELTIFVPYTGKRSTEMATITCEDLKDSIDAKIDEEKNPQKNLEIKIPRSGIEEKSFYMNIKSTMTGVGLYKLYVKWKDKKPAYIDDNSNIAEIDLKVEEYVPAELKFKVKPKATQGKYEFDIYIYYYYVHDGKTIFGIKKVDPILSLVKPSPTLPSEHPYIPEGNDTICINCHPQIRGSSNINLFGYILLSITLLIISIFVLRRNEKN